TKSVERAQNTVEQRNAETRKNVLKYDEVFNQQRKVIYGRRMQILEQGDLREETVEALNDVAEHLVSTHCLQELDDTWDLGSLLTELETFWSTSITAEELDSVRSLEAIRELIAADGLKHYEQREAEMGEPVMRQIERQVMLQMIDQRWRDHLTEMAHLREGINLRAMGQRDPLTEWQSEGYDLFSEMIHSLNVDYVRYVMHVEVVQPTPAPPADGSAGAVDANGSASDSPAGDSVGSANGAGKPAAATAGSVPAAPTATEIVASKAGSDDAPEPKDDGSVQPYVKDDWDKTPRNAPCPCGSGKKFKQCHG
ncbi:MAG: SEC-C metal-binding domain-containing protein, partial [Acidimicrobiales bacterium]